MCLHMKNYLCSFAPAALATLRLVSASPRLPLTLHAAVPRSIAPETHVSTPLCPALVAYLGAACLVRALGC